MKIKVFLISVIVFLIAGVNVFAKNYEVKFENKPDFAVVAKKNGGVISSVKVTEINNDALFEFESENEDFSVYLVYKGEVKKAEASEKLYNDEDLKDAEVKEEKEDAKQDNIKDKSFPDVYDIQKDAIRALMVVKSVSSVSEDGENMTELKVMFHGEEKVFLIPDEIRVKNVPLAYEAFENSSATSLKKGDAIWLTSSFSGDIDSISLMFRPTKENPLFMTTPFNDLFSADGIVAGEKEYKVMTPSTGVINKGYAYVFGVIKDRYENELEISDENGNTMFIEIKEGALIYKSDKEEKFEVEKTGIGSIRRSGGIRKSFDEDGNFVGWAENENYGYAFLRTIDGEATEIIIYENY